MNNFEIGDRVSVLDDAIDGEIIKIAGNDIVIKTSEDFVMTFQSEAESCRA